MTTNDNTDLSHSNARVVIQRAWGEPSHVAWSQQIRFKLFGRRFSLIVKLYAWESSSG